MLKPPTDAEMAEAKQSLRDVGTSLGNLFTLSQAIHVSGAVALRRFSKRVNTLYGLDLPVPTFGQAFLLVAAARNLRSAVFEPMPTEVREKFTVKAIQARREEAAAKKAARGDGLSFDTKGMPPRLAEQVDRLAKDIVAGLRDGPVPARESGRPRTRPATPPVTEDSTSQ